MREAKAEHHTVNGGKASRAMGWAGEAKQAGVLTWGGDEIGSVVQQQRSHPSSNLLASVWAALQALHSHLQQPGCISGSQLAHRALHHLVIAHGKALLQQLVVIGAQGLAEQHCH